MSSRRVLPEPFIERADGAPSQLAPPEVRELLALPRCGASRGDPAQPGLPGPQPDRLAAAVRDDPAPAVERVALGQTEVAKTRVRDRVQVPVLRDTRPHQERARPRS